MPNDKVTSKVKPKDGKNKVSGTPASGPLEKFTIVSFKDEKVKEFRGAFVASFNPNTFSVSHSSAYDKGEETGTGNSAQKFQHRNPRSLTVELFFDGTNASVSAKGSSVSNISSLFQGTAKKAIESAADKLKDSDALDVDARVTEFLTLCYDIDGTQHDPPFLVFVWGTFIFTGVLESANVSYSLFASNGAPLRAKISVTAKEHVPKEKLKDILRLRSPDLTQSRTVIAGDKLHNLAQEIYHDESLYLELAKVNNLHNYRKLVPGTQLIFPPIEKLKGRA